MLRPKSWAGTSARDADLVIEADGTSVMPYHRSGNRYWFHVPAAKSLVLRSNHGVLSQLMPGIADGRKLGVAVGEVRVNGESVSLEDAAFASGFYGIERHDKHSWRWTNGSAELKLALTKSAIIEVSLTMVAPSWKRPVPALRVVA